METNQPAEKNWLMRMRESKILSNLQQELVQNVPQLKRNAFLATASGTGQHSTQKAALNGKNAVF